MTDAARDYRVSIGAWVCDRLRRRADTVKIDSPGLDLFAVRGVVDGPGCAALMALIDANLTRPLVPGPMPDSDHRPSRSCHFDPAPPLVVDLEARIAATCWSGTILGRMGRSIPCPCIRARR